MIDLLQVDLLGKGETILESLLVGSIDLGLSILKALVILAIGRYVIKFFNSFFRRMLEKRDVAPSVRSFLGSLVNITLIILLIISVIGALGIQTTSFAALLASAGVAIGMALSGNLSNFAGGLIILLFKPFKVGDYISTSNGDGTVNEIQIFHTILRTPDNIRLYIPNGTLSSNYIKNYDIETRRIEWIFGVDYGEDVDKVRAVIREILSRDSRILKEPAYLIEVHQLDASSVNIIVRAWSSASDYWNVYFAINQVVYKTFNEQGINFPFPQMTIHKG